MSRLTADKRTKLYDFFTRVGHVKLGHCTHEQDEREGKEVRTGLFYDTSAVLRVCLFHRYLPPAERVHPQGQGAQGTQV